MPQGAHVNIIPRAISRLLARAVRGVRAFAAYDAAKFDRVTDSWRPSRYRDTNREVIAELPTILARSRDMRRNNSWVETAISRKSYLVCGTGVSGTIRVDQSQDAKGDAESAAILERAWEDFGTACDSVGIWSLQEFVRVIAEQLTEAGELFVVMERSPLLTLRAIEPEQLDTSKTGYNGNSVWGGIELDKTGKVVAYHFLKNREALIAVTESIRFEARDVCHIYLPKHAGQVRGVPPLAPVLNRIYQVEQFDRATVQAARIEANIAMIVTRQQGGGIGLTSEQSQADPAGGNYADFEAGIIFEGRPGDDVKGMVPTRPGGNYEPFMRFNGKVIAAASGLAYETMLGDFQDSNYSASRMAKMIERRHTETYQKTIQARFLDPVFYAWLAQERILQSGIIPRTSQIYVAWQWPPADSVDEQKELAAAQARLDMGLSSRKMEAVKLGVDIEEVDKDNAADTFVQPDAVQPADQTQGASNAE